jgi:RNA polymerase sigma-70 factor (ECF subfamily)
MADLDQYRPGIVAGDTEAFGRWISGAEPVLRDSLRRFAAAADVEAVLQESLLRVWQTALRLEDDGKPNGLLRLGLRIAHNLAVSEARRLRAAPVCDDELEGALVHAGAVDARPGPDPLLRKVIEECREKLPGKPALALQQRLAAGGGESDQELAARVGMQLNTFLQNFTRARRFLAECLERHGVDLEAELP